MPENPAYGKLGYIGFNRHSGELAFFDGSRKANKFSWKQAYAPPGGDGYSDHSGRASSSMIYDSTFTTNCAGCHDNKEPRIITPFIKQARVGYRDNELAKAFSLKELLPYLPRKNRTPYRVVGSAFTAAHCGDLQKARTIMDPAGNCTNCHGLTNQETGRFASDAVGRLGDLPSDKGLENTFRTDWALRKGAGKIHPWMVPGPGNDLSGEPPPSVLSDGDWNRLKAVIEKPDSDPQTLNLFTEAPAPEAISTDATRIEDRDGPTISSIIVTDNREGTGELLPKEIRVSWKYRNGLGDVPERDDVRFHMAILETSIPAAGSKPDANQFPSLEQSEGLSASLLDGQVFRDGGVIIIKDISFAGHLRWTDPVATTVPRQYSIAFPGAKNKRYLIRLVAKRFCFDQSNIKYSDVNHTFSVDVSL